MTLKWMLYKNTFANIHVYHILGMTIITLIPWDSSDYFKICILIKTVYIKGAIIMLKLCYMLFHFLYAH